MVSQSKLGGIAALVCAAILHANVSVNAAVTFRIQADDVVSVGGNAVTGTATVYAEVSGTDLDREISSFIVNVEAANLTGGVLSPVTLDNVRDPVGFTDLFPASSVDDESISTARASGASSFTDPTNPELFNNAGLVSFDFTVAALTDGSFDLVFSAFPNTSDMFAAEAGDPSVNPTFSFSTVNVTAVPEPSSLIALGLLGTGGLWRVRSRKSRRSAVVA